MDFEKLLNSRGKKITGGDLLHDAQRFGEKLRSPATVKAMKALRDAFRGGASLNQIREQQRREQIERLHKNIRRLEGGERLIDIKKRFREKVNQRLSDPHTVKGAKALKDRLSKIAKQYGGGKIRSTDLDTIKFRNSLRLGGSPSTRTPKYLSKPRPINSELLGSILNRREKLRTDEGSAFVH